MTDGVRKDERLAKIRDHHLTFQGEPAYPQSDSWFLLEYIEAQAAEVRKLRERSDALCWAADPIIAEVLKTVAAGPAPTTEINVGSGLELNSAVISARAALSPEVTNE